MHTQWSQGYFPLKATVAGRNFSTCAGLHATLEARPHISTCTAVSQPHVILAHWSRLSFHHPLGHSPGGLPVGLTIAGTVGSGAMEMAGCGLRRRVGLKDDQASWGSLLRRSPSSPCLEIDLKGPPCLLVFSSETYTWIHPGIHVGKMKKTTLNMSMITI